MKRILVICGAGASSSFLVHWMRVRITARGLDATVSAGSAADVSSSPAERMSPSDVILVASHLGPSLEGIAVRAGGMPVRLLPVVTFDAAGADIALDLAFSPAQQAQPARHTTPGNPR
ncbi:MAG: PTS sugar transporter subunit IIC [Burkholderiaceae bacterium]|nr:PTS sugar transporter subunit IIC [Microbacteriaceae bacterium]